MQHRARNPFARALVVAVLSLSAPRVAWADKVETARALFEQGVNEMMDGRFRSGCPSIAASYKLDPRAGTLFTLAQCDRHLGRIATAVKRYEEFLALVAKMTPVQRAKQARRVQDAKADVRKFEPAIPTLTIVLPPDPPKELVVKLDGRIVPRDVVGTAMPVDPVEHLVSSQVPGAKAFEVVVSLEEGERKIVDLAGRAKGPSPKPGKAGKAASVPQPVARRLAEEPPKELVEEPLAPRTVRRLRVAGLALGSAAFASLVVGGVTGALVLSKKSAIDANCQGRAGTIVFCFQQGVDAGNSAKGLALASTVGFVAGTVLGTATSVVLLSTLPASPRPRAGSSGALSGDVAFVSGGALVRLMGTFQ